jgi:hypothetical protein
LVTTWRNSRRGKEGISKQLDGILVVERIIEKVDILNF